MLNNAQSYTMYTGCLGIWSSCSQSVLPWPASPGNISEMQIPGLCSTVSKIARVGPARYILTNHLGNWHPAGLHHLGRVLETQCGPCSWPREADRGSGTPADSEAPSGWEPALYSRGWAQGWLLLRPIPCIYTIPRKICNYVPYFTDSDSFNFHILLNFNQLQNFIFSCWLCGMLCLKVRLATLWL